MSKSQVDESAEFQQMKPYKAKYTKTSMKKKQLLISMVIKEKFSIYRASKKLKISNSTAKSIITNYNRYGAILERNTKSSIEKMFTINQNEDQKEGVNETIKDQLQVKQQEVNEPLFTFSQEDRRRIIQKMGISSEGYPFLEVPLPYFYQLYKN